MNRIAFTEAYFQERKETRKVASNSVLRHFRMRKLKRKVVYGILISAILLTVFGTLLLVLPALKVQSILVEGTERIDEERVIEASGISIGDEILALNTDEIVERIAQTEGVETVKVRTSLSGVSIEIVED